MEPGPFLLTNNPNLDDYILPPCYHDGQLGRGEAVGGITVEDACSLPTIPSGHYFLYFWSTGIPSGIHQACNTPHPSCKVGLLFRIWGVPSPMWEAQYRRGQNETGPKNQNCSGGDSRKTHLMTSVGHQIESLNFPQSKGRQVRQAMLFIV